MAYITGTITSANPAADLYTPMATALTTAGYTLVDTVVISTRTHKIWKSAAANNAANLDWYLDVCYTTTGNGNMWWVPMEYFDPTTDLAYRMITGNNSPIVEGTYYSRYGATGYSLENVAWGPGLSMYYTNNDLKLNTTTFGYWISITGDRIIGLTSVAPGAFLYAGMYTPSSVHASSAGSSLFPLIYASMLSGYVSTGSSATDRYSGITRLPKTPSLVSSGWYSLPSIAFFGPLSPMLPTASLTVNSSFQFLPFTIYADPSYSTAYGTLGVLMDCGISYSSGIARGDTITISGSQWVMGSTNNGYVSAFKAA